MFFRGFTIGCAVMTALWLWLRQTSTPNHPVLHVVNPPRVDRAAVNRDAAQIIAHIQKEQSWILNHSAKPSTDS